MLPASIAEARTLHVSAGADEGGGGSRSDPLNSLASAERLSSPGDTIVVLPSSAGVPPLDGGIALKPGQRLVGAGPRVGRGPDPSRSARITNTMGARHNGDVVVLADRTTVRNIEIVGAQRGAIYGHNTSNVRILGNRVSAYNSSCAEGFHIPPFIAATNVPGVGIPISAGLINGWAAIMVDADRGRGRVTVSGNLVHDAACGDGIDVRMSKHARYRAEINSNVVRNLEQGPDFESLLAIGLQAADSSRLVARLDGNRQSGLGDPADRSDLPFGDDTEGIFVNPVDSGSIDAVVTRNTYTNVDGLGGFSSNGMEMVSMGDGSRARMVIRDSSFTGPPGDVIEEGALGTNAHLSLKLVNVVASHSVGFGNTGVVPFNNGDCVLAGSLGSRNTIELDIRDSELMDCANNGLSVGSNVVNGSGPTTAIRVDVRNSEITGNAGANLGVRNFTGLDSLSLRIEGTDLSDSRGRGSGIANAEFEDLGSTVASSIDLGGGALGSGGGNCLGGGTLAASVIGYDVSAEGNWWGSATGPGAGRTLAIAGDLDTEPFLSSPPPAC